MGINFFSVNDSHYFVDLPGYGFAKISASTRLEWKNMIEKYLKSKRRKIIFLLIDVRRGVQEVDNKFLEWSKFFNIECYTVFTKTDKIPKNLLREMKMKLPGALFTSSKSKEGLKAIATLIDSRVEDIEKGV